MTTSDWYLIAYDIADPRRLQRLQRALSREAMAVQRSVYLIAGSVRQVEDLLDRLATGIDPGEDDLRAYPIDRPEHLWLSGQRVLQGGLLHDQTAAAPQHGTPAAGWRQRLAATTINSHQPVRAV